MKTKKDKNKEINVQDKNAKVSEELSEVELLKNKAAEYLAGWQRAKADYLNLKKDSEHRQAEVIQFANAALIATWLPIFDNFKLALDHTPEELKKNEWTVGLNYVKKQFDEFLGKLGIVEIKTLGEKFNPEFHEAVASMEDKKQQDDTIIEQIKPGYTLHGKVVNPAQVKIIKNN